MTAIEWTRRLLGGGAAAASGPRSRRLMLRERLCPLGDDYPVEDEEGELVFFVDGRALRVGSTFVLRDPGGRPLYCIPQHALHQKASLEVEHGDGGGRAATVRRERLGTMRDRWSVALPDGAPLRLGGAVADHEYRVERAGRRIAAVSKRFFGQPGAYGVEAVPGEDEALLVTIAVAVDRMSR